MKKLGGALLIATTCFLFFVLVYTQFSILRINQIALAERSGIVEDKKAIIEKVKNLKNRYKEKEGDVNKIATLVPKGKNVEELITSLDTMARQSGLELQKMTASIQKNSSNKRIDDVEIISIQLDLSGSYTSTFAFLSLAEKSLRVLDVQSIGMSEDILTGGLNIKLIINSYFIK